MVAIQPFFQVAEPHGRSPGLRRARLGVVSSTLGTFASMPEHLRDVVAGIEKEIENRCFRPILETSDLASAMARAQASFLVFAELWPAALGAVAPWLLEDPDRLAAVGRALTDADESWDAIGDDAAMWFSAAQDARVAVVHALMQDGVMTPSPNEEEIVRLCVVADFAILFGIFLVQHPRTKAPEGLAVAIGKLGHESAKRAYVLATMHRFADPDPVAPPAPE
jgi:hypothetical protein